MPQHTVVATLDMSQPLNPALVAGVDGLPTLVAAHPGAALSVRLTGGSGPVPDWPGPVSVHVVSKWENALRRLAGVDAPTAARIEGRCTTAALELLLTVDWRTAAPGAVIGWGAPPGGGWPGMLLHRLVRQAGLARARRLTLLPGELSADALLAAGILDVVGADDPAVRPAQHASRRALPATGPFTGAA
ncbi:enoyl-CoA hydratase-related protein [Mangrovihabitans endophyticus]|uniref:Uncharacterized protein n=1 Tax=Mangrovihabitans endophyticus TaxID=1751298 RepID=A0A8J3C021_9ACTN|nr:enoyl-CoA hydratase-related protein [Mangrovihabitans endophyticus]GGK91115.1 hypothetical protein GCM10012284_26170 [Mangrovihabitans endophyticus]